MTYLIDDGRERVCFEQAFGELARYILFNMYDIAIHDLSNILLAILLGLSFLLLDSYASYLRSIISKYFIIIGRPL